MIDMTENPVFTLAWVTHLGEKITKLGEGSRVLFVKHPQRGWEIPGGHLNEGETPETALLRELKEETGCVGKIMSWNKNYYPKGWVAHVVVELSGKEISWTVDDANVSQVKWWDEVPPLIEWTTEEFQDLSEWCSSL